MSVLSAIVTNMRLLVKIFSVLCTGRTVTDSSIILKGLDHAHKSVGTNAVGLGALTCNSRETTCVFEATYLPISFFCAKIENCLDFK